MAEIDDGGPAFPHMMAVGHSDYACGASLRDWFAGQALPAVIEVCRHDITLRGEQSFEEYFADKAYAVADAMLKARAALSRAGA